MSIMSVMDGADQTAHSLNKVIFGVFKKFLDFFAKELITIDLEIENKSGIDADVLRNAFIEMINTFEARERRLYAAVAFRQRGKVPLRISPTIIADLHDKSWLLTDPKYVLTPTGDLVEGSDPKPDPKEAAKASHKAIFAELTKFTENLRLMGKGAETDIAATDKNALESGPKDPRKVAREEKQAINQIKDIYHASMQELIQTCEESLMGLTGILDLYRHMRRGEELGTFNYDTLIPNEDKKQNPAKHNRAIIRAATNLKRNITSKYFSVEIKLKLSKKDDDVRVLRSYFHTPNEAMEKIVPPSPTGPAGAGQQAPPASAAGTSRPQ